MITEKELLEREVYRKKRAQERELTQYERILIQEIDEKVKQFGDGKKDSVYNSFAEEINPLTVEKARLKAELEKVEGKLDEVKRKRESALKEYNREIESYRDYLLSQAEDELIELEKTMPRLKTDYHELNREEKLYLVRYREYSTGSISPEEWKEIKESQPNNLFEVV